MILLPHRYPWKANIFKKLYNLNSFTSVGLFAFVDVGPAWLGIGFTIKGGTCCRVIVTVARLRFLSYGRKINEDFNETSICTSVVVVVVDRDNSFVSACFGSKCIVELKPGSAVVVDSIKIY